MGETWVGVVFITETSFSKLKTAFCEFWTSIKIKISMNCAYKESEIKTKIIYTGAMAAAKNEVLFGLWHENCYLGVFVEERKGFF